MRNVGLTSLSIVALLATGIVTHSVRAEVRLQGPAEDIRLEAHDATIEEILAALHQRFALRYRGTTLNHRITATYEGPLRKILPHILAGYDYVIGPMGSNIEVIVLSTGQPRRAVAPVPLVQHRSD